MDIKILASDSMGVRSMATLVQTGKTRLALDPSAALGPRRYGLEPQPLELEELDKRLNIINKEAEKADAIVISHYHYDHYDPDADFYTGKTVFVKDWRKKINRSQKQRAAEFIPKIPEPIPADNSRHTLGDLTIEFSPPFYHGPDGSKLGWVISTMVDDGKTRFVHTSDVQGPLTDEATNWVIEKNPDVLFLCGCLTYFLGWRYPTSLLDTANNNVIKILNQTQVKTLIIDHHLVRDKNFREKIKPVYNEAEKLGKKVLTAAQFMGEKERPLEAYRKELWSGQTI